MENSDFGISTQDNSVTIRYKGRPMARLRVVTEEDKARVMLTCDQAVISLPLPVDLVQETKAA